ncbi:MAG: response regulator, partial [Chloroflexi bacterium]
MRVGFARERRYEGEDAGEAARATDTLAFLGRAEGVVSARPGEVLRVLAVEDHPVMRLGVQALLEREGLIVAGITAT